MAKKIRNKRTGEVRVVNDDGTTVPIQEEEAGMPATPPSSPQPGSPAMGALLGGAGFHDTDPSTFLTEAVRTFPGVDTAIDFVTGRETAPELDATAAQHPTAAGLGKIAGYTTQAAATVPLGEAAISAIGMGARAALPAVGRAVNNPVLRGAMPQRLAQGIDAAAEAAQNARVQYNVGDLAIPEAASAPAASAPGWQGTSPALRAAGQRLVAERFADPEYIAGFARTVAGRNPRVSQAATAVGKAFAQNKRSGAVTHALMLARDPEYRQAFQEYDTEAQRNGPR